MIPYKNIIDFEIFIADFIESLEPKSIEDIEHMADELHQSLETGIYDYIDGEERFNYDDYNPCY